MAKTIETLDVLIRRLGLGYEEAARRAGVPYVSLWRWRKGRGCPRNPAIASMARGWGVSDDRVAAAILASRRAAP